MFRRAAPIFVLLWVAAACTAGGSNPTPNQGSSASASGGATGTPSTEPLPSPSTGPIVLDVVATVGSDGTYLDGMRTAVAEVNSEEPVIGRQVELALHDDHGDLAQAERLIRDLAGSAATAILFVGPGDPVAAARFELEAAGLPLVLLEGDLYTSRRLFQQVFQTSIPWEWQANVLARYLVTDREADDVVFVGTGPEALRAEAALRSALGYWGGRLSEGFTDKDRDPRTGLSGPLERAARSDWTVVFGSPYDAVLLMNSVDEAASPNRPGIAGPAGLLVPQEGLGAPDAPNTVAPYTYTWAGWAEPISRVGGFRDRIHDETQRWPQGLEQEGYDAVRVLTEALKTTGGVGGPALAGAVETLRARPFSSFPVDFGPDDHVFLPRDELGLFAVAAADGDLDPWMMAGVDLWRPLMRTFTYDGERTNVLDRDRKVFFPFWGKNQPGPEYWRSRFGITSSPSDPLH